MTKNKKADDKKTRELPEGFPKSLGEMIDLCEQILLKGTEEQINTLWKNINRNDWEWPWIRVGLLVRCLKAADAKGLEEFHLIAINQHLKAGTAEELKETFTDPETNIEYRQYKLKDGYMYRVPIVTEGMGKVTFENAAEKKFLGDQLSIWSVDGDVRVPLDTQEKVAAANDGSYHKKFGYPPIPHIDKKETSKGEKNTKNH